MRAALILVVFWALPAFAGNPVAEDPFKGIDCKNAQVQMELNYCADRDFQAADKKLNATYRKLLDASDPKERELLKTAERNWIAYRDSECAYETA